MNNKILQLLDIETLKKLLQIKIIRDYNNQQYYKFMVIKNIINKESIINRFDDITTTEFKILLKILASQNDSDIVNQVLNCI